MSRLCLLADDVCAAAAYASLAVRGDAENHAARAALASALARRPDPALGMRRLDEALETQPELRHYNTRTAAPPSPIIERTRELLEDALRSDPALAPAHAALGNLHARGGNTLLAIPAYRRALDIDPQQPDAALALSELLFDIGETAASERYRMLALSQKQLYTAIPNAENAPCSVLVLHAPAPWAYNTPLEFTIDPRSAALHRLYLTGDPIAELPPHDLIFNAIGEAERAHAAIERAQQLIAGSRKRVVNRPAHLWKTARPQLASVLAGVHRCAAVPARRISRAQVEACADFPLLVRPIDTHAGRGLERIEHPGALSEYLALHDDERFDVTPFIEYRSADGYYRKYRVVLVDGKPYPYHLAISPEWMVHYIKTPTQSVEWMRAEEERFLREPSAVFSDWDRTFAAIAQAIGLDYFGVDCTLLSDGSVLVFEADSAMLVHCREPADSYKHRYVPRIFRALEALLTTRGT